jgi:hypothetical protein
MSGPTGSSESSGPTGDANTQNVDKMKEFSVIMIELIKYCEEIVKGTITSIDIIRSILIDLKLPKEESDIKNIAESLKKYKQCFATSDGKIREMHHLGLFNKILMENNDILLQSINNDSWIKNKNLKLTFGETLGKSSTLVVYLSQLYRYSLAIKDRRENEAKEYPELFKEDENVRYPNYLLYYIFRAFALTDYATDPKNIDKLKEIQKIVSNLGVKMGLQTNKINIMENITPWLSVGADLINKQQQGQPGGGTQVNAGQLNNIINKVLGGGQINNMISKLEQSARNRQGPPDFGSLISSMLTDLNPMQMAKELDATMKAEIPNLNTGAGSSGSATSSNGGPLGPEKPEKPEIIEEYVEETIEETIEEIVEEKD